MQNLDCRGFVRLNQTDNIRTRWRLTEDLYVFLAAALASAAAEEEEEEGEENEEEEEEQDGADDHAHQLLPRQPPCPTPRGRGGVGLQLRRHLHVRREDDGRRGDWLDGHLGRHCMRRHRGDMNRFCGRSLCVISNS